MSFQHNYDFVHIDEKPHLVVLIKWDTRYVKMWNLRICVYVYNFLECIKKDKYSDNLAIIIIL